MEAVVSGVFHLFLIRLACAHENQLVGHAFDDVFGAHGILKFGIDIIQSEGYTDFSCVKNTIEQGQNCLDLKIGVGDISAIAEVDARAASAFVACALLLSVFARAASLSASSQLNLDAVAVDFDVGDGDPFIAFDANAFFLEEFAEVFQVDAAVVEALVRLGIEVEIEAFLVGGQIERALYIFAEEEPAEGDFAFSLVAARAREGI